MKLLFQCLKSVKKNIDRIYGWWWKPTKTCWIGGGAVICPGVTIGDRCIIGAGSVVTKNIPDDSVAVGNPAKVIRKVMPER